MPEGDETDADIAVNYNMAVSMQWALEEIQKIQRAARSGNPITKPRWPMIIMRTPKGWSGPRQTHGNPIEGSWRAHQVPLPEAVGNDEEFGLLIKWLESYHPKELFNASVDSSESKTHNPAAKADGIIAAKALRIIPKDLQRRMGSSDVRPSWSHQNVADQ